MLDRRLEQAYTDACKMFCHIAGDPATTQAEWNAAWQAAHDAKVALTGCTRRGPTRDAYKKRFSNVLLRQEVTF